MKVSELSYLVVEDHPFQRRMLLKALGALGATDIQEASDGRSALEILGGAGRSVQVIVTDLDMPGMDGIEFLRHLGGFGVSVVLASAVGPAVLRSVEAMAAAYGVDLLGALEKPVSPDKLAAVLERRGSGPSAFAPRAVDRSYSQQEIRDALERDEFEPFFQPKVAFTTGRVAGFEALARWHHPREGFVSPASFLAAIEGETLAHDLTAVMLRKSAAACSQWRANGFDLSVAVNLSATSLEDVRFAESVKKVCEAQNLHPRHLVLEVTESTAVRVGSGPVLENLSRLRMNGIGLAIDDFGTGFSSMQQLAQVAYTELKIDRYFVHNALKQESSMVILRSSLEMARKLGLCSVAEGIETKAEWDLLESLGCDMAQGYFVSRPMQGAAVLEWLNRSGPEGSESINR